MIERFGLKVLSSVPLAVHVVELGLTQWLKTKANSRVSPVEPPCVAPVTRAEISLNPRPIARVKTFLKMAWLANPLAYIAINTVIPTIPALAKRLELSPKFAGFFCSAWLFARTAAFLLLWLWPGWHYRFRWLAGAYLAMLACFTLMLAASDLWLLVTAQIFFGAAIGLIYYSSLFYSMDVGEAKSEHGGIHEAAIGLGNFAGPAVGALSLHWVPQYSNSGTVAGCGLVILGLGGLLAIWWSETSRTSRT